MTAPKTKPPLGNNGGNQYKTQQVVSACHLDWLTYTLPYLPNETIEAAIARVVPPFPEFGLTDQKANPKRNYNQGCKLGIGAVSWHSEDRRMKVCVELTGKDFELLDQANIDSENVIAYLLGRAAKITRMDFAIDYYRPASPLEVYAAWEAGTANTKTKEAGIYQSAKREGGKVVAAGTVYMGSAKSHKQIRIYDKGKERKVKDTWYRIEYVTRDRAALALAQEIQRYGLVEAGRAAVRDFLNPAISWYQEAVRGRAIHLAPIPRKGTDTDRWLLDDVLPMLERQINQNVGMGDTTLLKAVYAIVDKNRKHLGKPSKERMEWSDRELKRQYREREALNGKD